MKTDVRIENVKEGRAGAICFADVTLIIARAGQSPVDLVTIKEVSLRSGENGYFLGMPQRSWTGRDGSTKYTRMVEMPKHTHTACLDAVQKAWEAHQGPQAAATPDPEEGWHDPFADQ
jgi:DNA-binding cell septation regulator SpoVG